MQRTYEITKIKGQDEVLVAIGTNGRYGWASYASDGRLTTGNHVAEPEMVEAIARVIATGNPETITIGEAPVRREPLYPADWCHECYNPRRQCEC